MVDRYTKAVLSVIALCLLYLCFTLPSSTPKAAAATQSSAEPIDVNVVSVAGRPFDADFVGEFHPAIPVREVYPPKPGN